MGNGESDAELCSRLSWQAVDMRLVKLAQLANDEQAKPRTGMVRGIEGLKQVFTIHVGNSLAVVDNIDDGGAAFGLPTAEFDDNVP